MNVRPLHDRIIVQRIDEGEQKVGGIIIPDSAKEKPQQGKVIAVGLGKREKADRVPLDVKAGDTILFGKYSGNEVRIECDKYRRLTVPMEEHYEHHASLVSNSAIPFPP